MCFCSFIVEFFRETTVYRDENSTALVTGLAIDLSHHQRGLWAATIWCERTSEDRTPINMGFVHSLEGIAPTTETCVICGRLAGEPAFARTPAPSPPSPVGCTAQPRNTKRRLRNRNDATFSGLAR